MRQTSKTISWLICLTFALAGCDSLEKQIEVPLPKHHPQLVAECYLQDGQPYKLYLTQTASYFEPLPENLFNPYNDAVVCISAGELRDTLRQEYSFDFFNKKFYNFSGNMAALNDPNLEYELEITDKAGNRRVTGRTRFLPKPDLDTVEYVLRDTLARILIWINDPPSESNYYRIIMHRDSLNSPPVLNFTFTDGNFNGRRFPIGTSYRFKVGDKLIVRLYHIEKAHYDYFELMEDAIRSNGNPFAQPVTLQSPLEGGYGLFMALSYSEKTLKIEKR